jgi:uncharacterized membrane protein
VNGRSLLSTRAAWRLGLAVAGGLVVISAIRFWLHDAFPYFVDYSEAGYRRYWPNRHPLLLHIVGGTMALFAGPFQLWSGGRARVRRLHRSTGYAYVAGITVSAASSFHLAFHTRADFGLSLFILAIAWLACLAMALVAIRNRRIDAHQVWMIRSYIITFAFVSYRALVSLSMFSGLGAGRHATVLWISWVVPMMLFELVNQWRHVMPLRRRAAAAAPAETPRPAWL